MNMRERVEAKTLAISFVASAAPEAQQARDELVAM